jgi:hypothetical protein
VNSASSGAVPKIGNHVEMVGQSIRLELVDVNLLMQTANLRTTDEQGHVTRNVPWTSLKTLKSVASFVTV